jgi:hypothetical protein
MEGALRRRVPALRDDQRRVLLVLAVRAWLLAVAAR